MTASASEGRLAALAGEPAASGHLTPQWRPIFEQVPRHHFIPDTI